MLEPKRISFAAEAAKDLAAFVLYQLLSILDKEGSKSQVELTSRFQIVHEQEMVPLILFGLQTEKSVRGVGDKWEITEAGREWFTRLRRQMKEI